MQSSNVAMLKITLLDSAEELRFRLEGKISGAWVDELRQCWVTASSTTGNRRTVVDLGEVDFVDGPGEALLSDMSREGVELRASTPFMRALVDQAGCGSTYDRVEAKPARTAHAFVSPDPS